jgi:hypothetical protein
LRGCGGGEESFLCVRGVEAGRAGTGLEKIVETGWLEEAKEMGWGTTCDWEGNGFIFEDGNGFGLAPFGTKLFVAVNGFGLAAAGNGFVVCPTLGNGFLLEVVGKGSVPRKPFCDEKGFGAVGAGYGEFVWPNGESPVACMGKVFERKGFAPVICDCRKLGDVGKGFDDCWAIPGTAVN